MNRSIVAAVGLNAYMGIPSHPISTTGSRQYQHQLPKYKTGLQECLCFVINNKNGSQKYEPRTEMIEN